MGRHSVVRGETGTYTHRTHKTSDYEGKHRQGVAKGTEAQQRREPQTTKSDLPHRDGRRD